jgi:hypothetical protein
MHAIFLFYKIREQEGRTGPVWGVGTSVRRKEWGKSIGVQMWCKYCVHMYVNGKMRPVETIPGITGDKGE